VRPLSTRLQVRQSFGDGFRSQTVALLFSLIMGSFFVAQVVHLRTSVPEASRCVPRAAAAVQPAVPRLGGPLLTTAAAFGLHSCRDMLTTAIGQIDYSFLVRWQQFIQLGSVFLSLGYVIVEAAARRHVHTQS
jgi:hypothetical protein